MDLSQEVWRGVVKKGYKVPTPIQRKALPLIIDGKDWVRQDCRLPHPSVREAESFQEH